MSRTRTKSARVVGLGLCVIDHLYVVEAFDPEAERTRFVDRKVDVGGMVSNALAQAAKLGCRAELISAVGADADGRLARRRMREAGVSTRSLVLSEEIPTTVALVLIARRDGERRFLTPDRSGFERRVRGFDLSALREGSVLLIDGHFPAEARRAARRARKLGVPVVADFSDPRPAYVSLLPEADHPVLPESFVRTWSPGDPADAIRRLHDEHGATAVVTRGAAGGLYWHDGRVRRYRSPKVRVVDTTGAGDAFHGAFAAGLALDLDLPEAVERAARAGAVACTALGGTGKLATRRQWEGRSKIA